MNDLAAQLAFDNSAMRQEVHEAEEGEGDDEGKEGGEIGRHADYFFGKLVRRIFKRFLITFFIRSLICLPCKIASIKRNTAVRINIPANQSPKTSIAGKIALYFDN